MKQDQHGGDIWAASKKAGRPAASIIDFSASINPLGPPAGVARAIKDAFKFISPYPDPGSALLKDALASYHGLDAREVLPANGSTELIYLIPAVLRPKSALIIEPAFSEYRRALALHGCKRIDSLVLDGRRGFRLDLKRLFEALKAGYEAVFICNPANPTGVLMKKDEMAEAARLCRKKGAALVVDEAFMDFCEEWSIKHLAAGHKGVVVLRSMTKFYSIAGLRVGFAVGHKKTVEALSRSIAPWSVNTLASFAAVAALKDAGFRRRTLEWLGTERAFLERGVNAIEALEAAPSGANYLMCSIKGPGPKAPRLKELLFERGMLIRDLSAIRGLGPGYFRIAVRKMPENRALLKALNEVYSENDV